MPTVLLSSNHALPWYRHFPDGDHRWGDWQFHIWDGQAPPPPHDHHVIFHDLPAPMTLGCPRERTLHVASEPPTVLRYHPLFLSQFGACLTQDTSVQHPNRLLGQPGMNWHVGADPRQGAAPGALSFRQLQALFEEPKTKPLSVVASNKAFTEGHRKRLAFAHALKDHFGDRIDFYGRGFRPMADKVESLRGYRFQVVLENTILDHYFTEKISDCILAGTFPLYSGCPNLEQYLPAQAFLRLDVEDVPGSISRIEQALAEDLDQLHRAALREARDQLMQTLNFVPMVIATFQRMAREGLAPLSPPRRFGQTLVPFRSRRFRYAARLAGPLSAGHHLRRLLQGSSARRMP